MAQEATVLKPVKQKSPSLVLSAGFFVSGRRSGGPEGHNRGRLCHM